MNVDALTDVERYLIAEVKEEGDSPMERCISAIAVVGAHRWGLDLKEDDDARQYDELEDAVADAMDDVASAGGSPVVGDVVVTAAIELLEVIEAEADDWNVHEPGPLATRTEEA